MPPMSIVNVQGRDAEDVTYSFIKNTRMQYKYINNYLHTFVKISDQSMHYGSIPDICRFLYTGRIFKLKTLHPKIPKKYPKNSKICSCLHSIWKILHLTELFYTGTARGARDKYQVCEGTKSPARVQHRPCQCQLQAR